MKYTHIRRCHVCGCTNESVGQLVSKCNHCGKHLSEFFFFDEKKHLGISEFVDPVSSRTAALPLSEYPPLRGLTASWDEIS